MLLYTGCQPGAVGSERERLCEGKGSIEEAVSILSLRRQNVGSLQGRADCIFYYKDDKGEEKRKEVSAVNVRFVPPDRILFRGNVFGEVVGFGSNENEFWLRVKPDMDSYWWGTRQQAEDCSEIMLINPYNVIEALGMVDVKTDWELSYQNGYDILTLSRDDGTPLKSVYMDACDYLVSRIEYFDNEGLLKASAALSDYTVGEDGLAVPQSIEVTQYQFGIREGSVEIQLKHVRPFSPNEEQRRLLFKRPEREGFEHMYRLNDACQFVEEQE
jgi:hypothetical protein